MLLEEVMLRRSLANISLQVLGDEWQAGSPGCVRVGGNGRWRDGNRGRGVVGRPGIGIVSLMLWDVEIQMVIVVVAVRVAGRLTVRVHDWVAGGGVSV